MKPFVDLHRMILAVSITALTLHATNADALTAKKKCQAAIAKSTAKYAQARLKVLQKCEDRRFKSGGVGSCPNAKAQGKIDKAEAKKIAGICKACGGADKACDGNNDLAVGDLGWKFRCPGFEEQGASFILSIGGIVACVDDINSRAVDQLMSLLYGITPSAEPSLLKCQRTIGKNVAKFFQAKSKATQKCWDARIKGKHPNVCPDPGDGKAAGKIQSADAKKDAQIHRACDAFIPSDIGITACPDFGSCGAITVGDIQGLIDCVNCVARLKGDCVDALQMPQFVSYPPECAGAAILPTFEEAMIMFFRSRSTVYESAAFASRCCE